MARTDERFREAFNAMLDLCARLRPDESLPSEPVLADRLGVSRTVVRAGLGRLRDRGVIRWEGRAKRLLRAPGPGDRLDLPDTQRSPEAFEAAFLDWVLRADVSPGTALNVADLARRFGVTPHVLQEFLSSLSPFGLVARRDRGGWEVQGFTPDFAMELADFRQMLELAAIDRLLDLPDAHPVWPRLAALGDDHRRLLAEIDRRYHDFSHLDQAFHATIASAVPNRFADAFGKIIALVFHYHFQWDKRDERDRNRAAIHEHLRLIAALQARDRPAARAAALAHLHTARISLLAALRRHDACAAPTGKTP